MKKLNRLKRNTLNLDAVVAGEDLEVDVDGEKKEQKFSLTMMSLLLVIQVLFTLLLLK